MSRKTGYQLKHSQNFLVNERLIETLVDAARFSADDTVVEIGPGRGIITLALARHVGHVLAYEYDDNLVRHLVNSVRLPGNVTLFHSDFLTAQLPVTPFRVFANIPFRHTSAIVGKLTTGTAPPTDIRLVMQREAAERYLIGSTSTLQAQLQYPFRRVEIIHIFRPQDFRPQPNVEAVMLHIADAEKTRLEPQHMIRYEHFLTATFGAWKPNLEESLLSVLPRDAYRELSRDREIRGCWRLKVSQVPADIWIAVFKQLIKLNDELVWQRLAQSYQRIEADRQRLDRPTRTQGSSRRK